MARSRVVIELLRKGDILNAAEYMTNEMSKDLECKSDDNDFITKWRWNQIGDLFTCSVFVPVMFHNNQKYDKLLQAKYQYIQSQSQQKQQQTDKKSKKNNKNNKNKESEIKKYYEKCKTEFKNDLKKKIPKHVYKLFFKPSYFWKKMEDEFWRIFKLIYGLNKYSMLEYVLSTSLQTLVTPYCYHKEWAHSNCITCVHARNKMSKLCHKSHIRGIELPYSLIICDKESDINQSGVKNKEYFIIRNQMIDNEETISITENDRAKVTPNGCIIAKESAQVLVGTNRFVKKDFETPESKIFLYYDLF